MEQKKVVKVSKWTMTDISMMEKVQRPAQLKPSGPPRRRTEFADKDKQRQSDLTDQEVKLARQIWAEYVEPIKEEFISLVFEEFFAKHPEMSDLFLRLDTVGLPRLSLDENSVFKNHHFARIMFRLRTMMDNMDKPERLTKLMAKLGVLYAKVDVHLNTAMLDAFQNAMVSTIRIAMKNQMLPSEETALRKCFEMAFSIMQEASFIYYDLFVATVTKGKDK